MPSPYRVRTSDGYPGGAGALLDDKLVYGCYGPMTLRRIAFGTTLWGTLRTLVGEFQSRRAAQRASLSCANSIVSPNFGGAAPGRENIARDCSQGARRPDYVRAMGSLFEQWGPCHPMEIQVGCGLER